jgi:hypothetical protein
MGKWFCLLNSLHLSAKTPFSPHLCGEIEFPFTAERQRGRVFAEILFYSNAIFLNFGTNKCMISQAIRYAEAQIMKMIP